MTELKPCLFCGNTKIGVVRSKYNGIPSGDDGWRAVRVVGLLLGE